jgi:hypothetical protein
VGIPRTATADMQSTYFHHPNRRRTLSGTQQGS